MVWFGTEKSRRYRVNDYAGIPVCDQEEMFTATWLSPEQILAQDVPGGLVFDPFRRSVEEYLDQLGLTLDDFDESKHKRDEKGRFSSSGGSVSSKSEKSSVTKQGKSDTIKSQSDDVPPSISIVRRRMIMAGWISSTGQKSRILARRRNKQWQFRERSSLN